MDELKSMFPTVDVEVIEAVFAANDHNTEATINALLEMNDPNHKQPPKPAKFQVMIIFC